MPITASLVNENLPSLLDMLKNSNVNGLLELKLWNCDLDDEDIKLIADFLKTKKCSNNFRLDLGDNNITFDGIAYLADALKSGYCPHGLWLGLWNNEIGDEGASMLAKAVTHSNCPDNLQLHLGHAKIGKTGIEELAKALKHPHCAKSLFLNIYQNAGVEEALSALADGLKRNTSARLKISLNDDDISCYERQLINIYQVRNELIRKNPDYESYIKAVCYQYDLFTPALKHHPLTLKECSAMFVLKHNLAAENDEQKLPTELIEYLEKLKFLSSKIEDSKKIATLKTFCIE